MNAMHPAMVPSLQLLPRDRPVALLTRHSLRDGEPQGIAGYDVPLTAAGVALAEAWGQQLQRPLHSLHSSPVGRCVDTAAALARGAGMNDLRVHTSAHLVEPGCYVHSVGEVGPLFMQLGPLAFANRHLRESLGGILSPAAGAAKIVQHIRAQQGPAGSLTVHVTHDTILAAFIYFLLQRAQLQSEDWPWMLEGAWLWFDDDDALRWIWRGELGRRHLADLI